MMLRKLLAGILAAALTISAIPAFSAHAAAPDLNKVITWAVNTANDDTHGYSQAPIVRWGKPDYDCSSFVISAFKQAGFSVSDATYTGDMKEVFMANGFTWIPASQIDLTKADGLLAGDVLWRSGHTELYIGNGKMAGASKDYDGEPGDSTGKEVLIRQKFYYDENRPWAGILRYTGAVSTTPQTPETEEPETPAYAAGFYKLNISLNVRKGAGTSFDKIGMAEAGSIVSAAETDGSWGKISVGKLSGWICLDYCTASSDPFKAKATIRKAKATTTKLKVTWPLVATADGYRIYYCTSPNGKYKKVTVKSSTKQTYTFKNLKPGTIYYYRVRPYRRDNTNGKTIWGVASSVLPAKTTVNFKVKGQAKRNINLRKASGKDYDIITSIPKKKKMWIIGITKDNTGNKWYQVKVKISGTAYKGYVKAANIKKIK